MGGFPKAHEILEFYAKYIGKTKNEVFAAMTVRQENKEKKYKYASRKKKRKKDDDECSASYSDSISIRDSTPTETMCHKLDRLLNSVSSDRDIFDGFYDANMLNLEIFIAQITSSDEHKSFAENNKIKIGISYYLFAEYYHQRMENEFAIDYLQKSQSLLESAN